MCKIRFYDKVLTDLKRSIEENAYAVSILKYTVRNFQLENIEIGGVYSLVCAIISQVNVNNRANNCCILASTTCCVF